MKHKKKFIIVSLLFISILFLIYLVNTNYLLSEKYIIPDKIGIIDGNISTIQINTIYNDDSVLNDSELTHGDRIIQFLNNICLEPKLYYYNASNEDNYITDQSIIAGLDWMLSNNISKVNISLSSKQYSKDLENWISQNKDSVQIYASYNNLLNSYDYPAMYDNVIASGSNNNINLKAIDRYYKKSTILIDFPKIKRYDGNSFLSLLTLVDDMKNIYE